MIKDERERADFEAQERLSGRTQEAWKLGRMPEQSGGRAPPPGMRGRGCLS